MFSGVSANYFGFNLRFILEVGIVTLVILLFGEILPKVYASRNNIQFSLFMALPLNFLNFLLTPISSPMSSGIQFIEKKFGSQKSNISVDQLSQALALSSEKDKLHEDHKILQGIVTFGNTDTKQVMKPRMDIFALDDGFIFSLGGQFSGLSINQPFIIVLITLSLYLSRFSRSRIFIFLEPIKSITAFV